MKTIEKNKSASAPKSGKYSSIDELIYIKMERAAKTLKNVDLNKAQLIDRKG